MTDKTIFRLLKAEAFFDVAGGRNGAWKFIAEKGEQLRIREKREQGGDKSGHSRGDCLRSGICVAETFLLIGALQRLGG